MAPARFNAGVGSRRVRALTDPFSATQATRSARAGMREVVSNYKRLVQHLENVTPEILMDALEPTFEKSKSYCPKDTGRLVKSGYLEIIESRNGATVEIGYGRGSEPPYAAIVHENMEWHHKAPTRAKWLQVALEEDSQLIQDRIVNAYRGVLA